MWEKRYFGPSMLAPAPKSYFYCPAWDVSPANCLLLGYGAAPFSDPSCAGLHSIPHPSLLCSGQKPFFLKMGYGCGMGWKLFVILYFSKEPESG